MDNLLINYSFSTLLLFFPSLVMFAIDHNTVSLSGFQIPVALLVLFTVTSVVQWTLKFSKKYPPGPMGIPFFGNLFQLSKQGLNQWGHIYGDMAYLKVFGQGILLINSHTAAIDLLHRRSTIYSDRPSFVVINALTRGLFLGVLSYGDVWRKFRRGGHESMSKGAMGRYHKLQEREALIFTENLLKDSSDWHQEVSRMTISMLLSTVYDLPATISKDDPIIAKFNRFDNLLIEAAFPGNYLVEFFHWIKFLPSFIVPWKKRMADGYVEFSAFFEKLWNDTAKQVDAGEEKPGIAGYILRERQKLGFTEAQAAWLPATYANGSASITEVMLWFFLAMVAFPEQQKRCQDELDAVVGRSRMPTASDAENLPYMKALVKEVLRWRPVSPLGTQHVVKQDDWYEGRFIPKGTMCFANIWLMNRDKTVYGEDADEFNPGRFLDKDGNFVDIVGKTKDGYLESEGHVAYGFGARICPGRYYANEALLIVFSRLLWAATIKPGINASTGKSTIPDLRETVGAGITMRPPNFDIMVQRRFDEAPALLLQTKELL
ncbi:Cytochrome P450 monooxygenase [Psilocybe cubensis]|uniref:Cytochrome P450 monooxygenase n=2 Tax=Psilocybe cubensis TaxID=181762 RepID=A0ACB8GS30_PSICU|nr:Cytochrome P450 monooxygenase [Psilocybe cubensis]KAH9478540.1 Cytochrome P450 monooxygenase [Psilocybe cubensis]